MIAVVDYGAGNVQSVRHALEYIGQRSILTKDECEIERADAVILPGVGAFGDAMAQLEDSGVRGALQRYLATARPFLGICIGEQLLFESSEETPGVAGLGWLPGMVRRIPAAHDRKVPHMGWNRVQLLRPDPLFEGLPQQPWMYFVHSFYVDAQQRSDVLAKVSYGPQMDVAVRRDNLWAVQFHPEKSGENGLMLLRNFARMQ